MQAESFSKISRGICVAIRQLVADWRDANVGAVIAWNVRGGVIARNVGAVIACYAAATLTTDSAHRLACAAATRGVTCCNRTISCEINSRTATIRHML